MKRGFKSILILLPLLLALSVLAVFWRDDLYSAAGVLRGVQLRWFVAAIALYFGSIVIWALRWRVSLSYLGFGVDLKGLYLILSGSVFINNITPLFRGGADPLGRVYLLGKLRGVPYSSALSTTFLDHLFDFPVVISFLMLGLLLGVSLPFSLPWFLFLWLFLLLFPPSLVFGVVRKEVGVKVLGKVLSRLGRLLGRRRSLLSSVREMYRSSSSVLSTWRCVLPLLLLSLLIWLLDLLRLFLVFLSLSYRPGLPMLLLATSLPTLAGLVPFLPGGLVLVEATMLSVFTFFRVPLPTALAAVLLERTISLILSTLVGAGVLSYLGLSGLPLARRRPTKG
ncbi:MAG: flippase-like domain-containing protein [Candidatus Hadarchaeales archaeon]